MSHNEDISGVSGLTYLPLLYLIYSFNKIQRCPRMTELKYYFVKLLFVDEYLASIVDKVYSVLKMTTFIFF